MELETRIREAFVPIRNASSARTIKRLARRRRLVRRGVGLAAAVAAAALAAVIIPIRGPGLGQRAAEASTMSRLASVARAQPAIAVGEDEYLYTAILGVQQNCDGNACRWDRVRREVWAATDGSGRIAGSSRLQGSWSEVMGPGELGGSLQDDLPPTDPDELRSFIEKRASMAEQPLDWEMWVITSDLLGETYSSPVVYSVPELRAALFDIAAALPGVEDLGRVTDSIGRQGVGFGFTGPSERMQMIFDPETATILEMRRVPLHRLSSAERVGWTVFLEVGVVDSVRDRP